VIGSAARDLRKWRFWRHFTTHFFASIGLQSALLSLYDVVFPGRISRDAGTTVIVVLSLAVVYAIYRAYPRPIEQHYNSANTRIRVIFGDLFEQDTDLVVGFCDTFDTSIPVIIEPKSVQGQFIHRVYGNDIAKLDADIDTALALVASIGNVSKPGKTDRYPIGTVALLRENLRRYYCLAYTSMNEDNKAQGTADGIWRSLESLWSFIASHGNGQPVAIPVIGGGLARVSQILPAQDSIRFIALSFMLASRREHVCERLDIVVRTQDAKSLDSLELQSFLRSLRAS
jgi:Domain of unknown function (DUF6430)